MRRRLRLFLAAVLAPITSTVLAHQAFAETPVTAFPQPVSIAAFEHTGDTIIAGLTGPVGLLAVVVVMGTAATLWVWSGGGVARLTPVDLVAFGLLAGGALSNTLEIILRSSVLDWLWISLDGRASIAMNLADAALFSGIVLLALRTIARLTTDARELVTFLRSGY
jgi:lipoprotein signal peptidase